MIKDASGLAEIQSEWAGVLTMLNRMKLLVTATFASGAFTAPALAMVLYNLPLLLAFDVLNHALIQLRVQGEFGAPSDHLGALVKASKEALPWRDWQFIRDGVWRRNEVAHDGVLHEAAICLRDISAIETQLVAWGIIDAP